MRSADTRVILVAGSGDVSGGFDAPGDLRRVPAGYNGAVWTNRVESIAELLRSGTEQRE